MIFPAGDIILNGKYRVEELAGKGAFAEVYRVTHLRLNAPRALKVLRRDMPGVGSSDFQDYREQFDFEAQLGAKLDHPNVVKVHDFEEAGDDLCLVMEWAPGGSLEKRLKEQGPLSVAEAVRLALHLCDGLTAIHEQLRAVHRDLKPSNILFGQDGAAKVGDLGLAQVASGLSRRSLLGSLASYHPGTPAYMSPEQGISRDYLLPGSDIFSLGCVLFEALTGIPYKSVYGSRVSDHRQETPDWLDGIVARALREQAGRVPEDDPDVATRYRTASAVRTGIERVWQAEQEQAEEESRRRREAAEQAKREARAKADEEARQQREAEKRRKQEERDRAAREAAAEAAARRKREQAEREAEERHKAEEAELARLFDEGLAALQRREWSLARSRLSAVVHRCPDGYWREGRTAAELLAQAEAVLARRRRTNVIAGLATAALLVLIAAAVLLSRGNGGQTARSGESISTPFPTGTAAAALAGPTYAPPSSPSSAATPVATPSASASTLVAGPSPTSRPPSLAPISPANAARVAQLARWDKGRVVSAAWSNDGKYLAVGSFIGVYLYAADTLDEVWLADTQARVRSVSFSPDGKILASGSDNDTVKLWEVATGRELRTLAGHSDSVYDVAFARDGMTLASASGDKTVKLWEVATGRELRTPAGHSKAVEAVAFSSDGGPSPRGATTARSSCGRWPPAANSAPSQGTLKQ
ncbi:MAG: protein kinase [Chloroflexi bacterium]|nr:protein kinase [Chloroflexota bacterium]